MSRNANRKLPPDREVAEMYRNSGMTFAQLADYYGVTPGPVHQAVMRSNGAPSKSLIPTMEPEFTSLDDCDDLLREWGAHV